MTERFTHLDPQDPDDLKQGTETHQVVKKAGGLVLRIPITALDVEVVIRWKNWKNWLHELEEPDHYVKGGQHYATSELIGPG